MVRIFIPLDPHYVSNAAQFYFERFGGFLEYKEHSFELRLRECIIVVTSRTQGSGVPILELPNNNEVVNSIIQNSDVFAEIEISANDFRRGVIAKRRDPYGVIWVIRENTGPLRIEDVCTLCHYAPLHYPAQCSEIRNWQALDDDLKQTVEDYGQLSIDLQEIREGRRSYECVRELRGHQSVFKCFEELESLNGIFARVVICRYFNQNLTTDWYLNHLLGVAREKYYTLLAHFPNPPQNLQHWLSNYEVVITARSEAADAIRQVLKRVREVRYPSRANLNQEEEYMNSVCSLKVDEAWRHQNSTV